MTGTGAHHSRADVLDRPATRRGRPLGVREVTQRMGL